MATQFASPGAAAAPPAFLLARGSESSFHLDFSDSLRAAVIAEGKRGAGRRERCRIAALLCELGCQLRARRGEAAEAEMPLSRNDMASLLGISLVRAKRALGLLSLSGVISTDGQSITVLDWRRLCGVASFDPARLGITAEEQLPDLGEEETEAPRVTAAGDPACFV